MERDVLKFLNFEMGTPTAKTFLRQECCKMLLDCLLFVLGSNVVCYGIYVNCLSCICFWCPFFLPHK
jgi:hypothetical protein